MGLPPFESNGVGRLASRWSVLAASDNFRDLLRDRALAGTVILETQRSSMISSAFLVAESIAMRRAACSEAGLAERAVEDTAEVFRHDRVEHGLAGRFIEIIFCAFAVLFRRNRSAAAIPARGGRLREERDEIRVDQNDVLNRVLQKPVCDELCNAITVANGDGRRLAIAPR